MKVSIIVPLYKAELYIRDCFDSLSSQTYKNVEMIFVDDGSPDNSGEIAEKFARYNDNVVVIHQTNGGASAARNTGVKAATGDYMMFVDGDDFLKNKDSLERIIAYAERKNYPDIIGFNICYYFPSNNKYTDWVAYSDRITEATDKEALVQELIKSGTLPVSPCGKLIKRDAYNKCNINFIEGTIGEDIPWTILLFDKVKSIAYINEYHYCYRQEVSTSVTGFFSEKKFLDLVNIVDDLVPLIKASSFSNATKECLYSFAGYELSIAMSSVHRLQKYIKPDTRKRLKQLCWLLQYTQNPKVRMVSRVYNMFGYAITERVLRMYKWYRARRK